MLFLVCLQGIPFVLDDQVEVVPTPGHTGSDVSVIVKDTPIGTVVIAGWSIRERHFQLGSDIFLILKIKLTLKQNSRNEYILGDTFLIF